VGIPHSVTKGPLAAANASIIASSQSPGAGVISINGAASNRIPVNTNAASPAGTVILFFGTTAGIVPGSPVIDGSALGTIVPGTTVLGISPTTVTLSQPIGGAGVGNGDLIIFGATSVLTGTATLDTQRRVLIPSNGSDNSGITFTFTGTADNGTPITDTIAGPGVTNGVITNLDFKTITNVTHTGTVTGAITIGTTSGAGLPGNPAPAASTPWFGVNWHAQPVNIELAGVVTGTVNYTWQYTYDDPNNLPSGVLFPQPFNHPTLNNQAVSLDGSINDPVAAVRLVVNSGAGSVRGTWMEAGVSGQ
jgi:hypothetical protein